MFHGANSREFRALLVALACLLAASDAGAQSIPYTRHTLDNGLTVILHEDRRVPIVVVNTWYHVGSRDERKGRTGFAHLFEHLMFMGTDTVPNFDPLMEQRGGRNNATTSADRTNYFDWGPSNLLETFLFLESDRLRRVGGDMTRKKLDLQRDVVRNERRQNYEIRPYGVAFLEMWPFAYPEGHPYHHPVIGSHEDLENATVDDVATFFERYYSPSNASLVIAGDFDSKHAMRLVEKYFGEIPAGTKPEPTTAAPVKVDASRTKTLVDEVTLPRSMLIYHSPAFFAEGDADMDILASVMGEEKTGRLYRRLVHEKGLAQDVSASQWSFQLGSLFLIQVTARPGVSLKDAEAEIDAVLAEFDAKPPSERDCARVVNQYETLFWSQLESVRERADFLNRYQFHFGEPDFVERDLGRYRAVTPESVVAWKKKVLAPNARLTLRILPKKSSNP